ncbi:MAG: hypothetical protein JWQ72_2363 [Polaromonas sp.]|nr:hypothetical protein [Polaromonas sp.]
MFLKILVGFVALSVWIGAIVARHFWPDVDVGQLLASAQLALVGLGVYHLSGAEVPARPPAPPAAPPADLGRGGQGGSVILALLVLVAICLMLVTLTGCAGLNVSWVATASYNTPASTTAVMTPGGAAAGEVK